MCRVTAISFRMNPRGGALEHHHRAQIYGGNIQVVSKPSMFWCVDMYGCTILLVQRLDPMRPPYMKTTGKPASLNNMSTMSTYACSTGHPNRPRRSSRVSNPS